MTKPELGVRRRCLSCEAAFYDLNREPITCVKCGAVFTVVQLPRSPPRRAPMRMNTPESIIPAVAADDDLPETEEVDDDQAGEENAIPPIEDEDDADGIDGIIVIKDDPAAGI